MKTLPLVALLFLVTSAFSQNGKIAMSSQPKNPEDQASFLYKAPEGLFMPEDLQVNVSCSDIRIKSIPLEKEGSDYEFSMKLPASSSVLFFTISDSKENVVDNNSDKGYVVFLKDPSGEGKKQMLQEKIQSTGMAAHFLKLDYAPEDILNQYASLFESYPELKNESSYSKYLLTKFYVKKEEARPELIEFAEKMAGRQDEESLTAAYNIYRALGMDAEKEEVEKAALELYPKGEIARSEFMEDYFRIRKRDEAYITRKIIYYMKTFGEPLDRDHEFIYYELIMLYLDKKDTLSIEKYKDLITDKNSWINIYNSYAWRATGGDLTSPVEDLDFVEQISRKSMDLVEYLMAHPDENDGTIDLKEVHRMCADTYALILYKQKKYDLAFQYQQEIVDEMGDKMYADGKERYAAFAEKAKGPEFAREYLEKELLAGTDSKIMVDQLQQIYSELNLPENEFENIKKQYKESAAQKDRDEIIDMYGQAKAIDFTLTNLAEEKITLSAHTGKVVVLDFWATWCGPCISSFPKMQEMVNEFENEKVEFFFINSWERQEPEKIKEKVVEFIEEKGYNFNVLFDYSDEVITDYKVRGIPTTFLIGKDGNLKAIIRYRDDLAGMIRESL